MRIASVAVVVISLLRVARADGPIDIEQAIARAAAQHPLAREDRASVRAADAQIEVERSRYLPDVEVFAQLDRSTSNTSVGALYPEPGVPVVAGTPGRSLGPGAFGSGVGVTASWDVLGRRRWDAQIEAAEVDARAVRDGAAVTDLERAFAVADRFIAVIAHVQGVKAARSGVDRARVFVTIVKAAVDQNLRAGADLSRALAELSLAETALIRAESATQVSTAQLAEALGGPAPELATGKLLDPAPRLEPVPALATDPRIAAATAQIDAAKARKSAIEAGTDPRLAVVGGVWARGGNDPGGLGAAGLVPDVPNWSVGLVLTWPVLAGKLVAPRARVEDANIARGEARADAVRQHAQSQLAQAAALVEAAYRIADKTPATLAAARDAEQQATARYQAKLATADDVAAAQRLLEQAEIDDAVARLDVWRAILGVAYARGDLGLFTAAYHGAGR